MIRRDFITKLFDHGDGLTLDQIENLEKILPGFIPEDMPMDEAGLMMARDNFINDMHDCEDMLELRAKAKRLYELDLTDMQVYRLYNSL